MTRKLRSKLLLLVPFLALSSFAAGSAHAYDNYGAIAYSVETRSHAWSYDYPSRAAAEYAALQSCQRNGSGCFVAVWFRNACGALAFSNENGGYGTGWSRGRGTAERIALNYCQSSNGYCQLATWACTSR